MKTTLLTISLFVLLALPLAAADPYPAGTVAFFNTSTGCPAGWSVYQNAVGRTVLPFPAEYAGETLGNPLASGAEAMHGHAFDASIQLGSVSYALVPGPGNNSLTSKGRKTSRGETAAASIKVPYVQYLVCEKGEDPPAKAAPPSGVVVFSSSSSGCATGWTAADRLNGRLVVGLPIGGTAEAAFGGAALGPGQFFPQHVHEIDRKVEAKPYGVLAVKGGAASGYGKRGTYDATGATSSSISTFPYVMLVPCLAQ